MEVRAHAHETERLRVSSGGEKSGSGRIYVPKAWVGEEVLVLRVGNPPAIVCDDGLALESTLDDSGYKVIVLNADSKNPTRVAIPSDILDKLTAHIKSESS